MKKSFFNLKQIFMAMILTLLSVSFSSFVSAKEVASVTTEWRALGKNDRIVVENVLDKETGVVCYLSYAKTGGLKEVVNLEEDKSDNGLNCLSLNLDTINSSDLKNKLKSNKDKGVEIFQKDSSLFFKDMKISRFYDDENEALVYIAYSRKIISGSPKHSISVVKLK